MVVSLARMEQTPPKAGDIPPLYNAEHFSAGYAWATCCPPRYDMPDAKLPNQSPSAGEGAASYGLRPVLGRVDELTITSCFYLR